jgi:hypothetical protein
MSIDLWCCNNKPPRLLAPAMHQTSEMWRPTLTQAPHFQLAEFKQSSSPLNRCMHFNWLELNESPVILTNAYPHMEDISLRTYSDVLDPSGPVLLWQKLPCAQISTPNSTKEFHAPRHTSSPINKLKYKQMIKHAYYSRQLHLPSASWSF